MLFAHQLRIESLRTHGQWTLVTTAITITPSFRVSLYLDRSARAEDTLVVLRRIPEPELMLDPAQAKAYAEADFEEAHQSVVAHLQRCLPELPTTAHVLDAGCGPCDVTRRLALAFPNWTIDAIDASRAMLRLGQGAISKAGLDDRVKLHELHLPAVHMPQARYDVIVSNSLLHHLATPDTLWQTIRRFGAPGASVFVMDLSRPANTSFLNQLLQSVLSEPKVLQQDFHNSLLAAYTEDEVRTQLIRNGLGLSVERVSNRHWVAWGRV